MIRRDIFIQDFVSGLDTLTADIEGMELTQELRLYVVYLLVVFAKSDLRFTPEELTTLVGEIERMFGSSSQEASRLIEVVSILPHTEEKVKEFTGYVVRNFSTAQRQIILKNIWKLAYADSKVNHNELVFIITLRSMLGLTLEQGGAAQALAEHEIKEREKLLKKQNENKEEPSWTKLVDDLT